MGKGKYLVSYLSNPHKLLLLKKVCIFNYSNCLVNALIFSKRLFNFTGHFFPYGVRDILQRGNGLYNSAVQAHNFQNDRKKIMLQEDEGEGQ